MSTEKSSDRSCYCRTLGHEVPLSYCCTPGQPNPCRHILNCWWEIFDIASYAKEKFTSEQMKAILSPPPPKIQTLHDLIREAQERVKAKGST